MKKNVMMRLASVLLVCVLLSTSVISGTFAKYVSEGSGNDTARVAKWGVTVTAESTMFATEYKTHDGVFTGAYSVDSSNTDKLVAPGTDGKMIALAVTGTPEVATRISYTPEVTLGNNWIDKDDLSKFYCPIKVTIVHNNGNVTLCGLDYASAAEFETAIEDNITAATVDYAANTDLSKVNDDLSVSWAWPFESDGSYLSNTQTDAKDTFLGDRAAGDLGNAGQITIDLTVTVTQID